MGRALDERRNTKSVGDSRPGGAAEGVCQVLELLGGSRFADISDGLSNTVLIGEKHVFKSHLNKGAGSATQSADGNHFLSDQTAWYECHTVRNAAHPFGISKGPNDNSASEPWKMFGSWHPSTCQFLLGDGSVRGIRNTIDVTTLTRLGDRRDGEVLGEF